MKSTDVKAVIVEHFPAFEFKKVYNEVRQNGGTIIKFWCAKGFEPLGPTWQRLKDVLYSMGVVSVLVDWNTKHGGCNLLLSV